MGDMGDFWRGVNGYSQAKRWSNLESSTGIMERSGVPFVSKNNGVHLIVADRWDYWPSTGLFIDRITKKKGRGVNNLLRCARGMSKNVAECAPDHEAFGHDADREMIGDDVAYGLEDIGCKP